MADVFDFNEGDEDCWSFDSPTDGNKAVRSPFSMRPGASPKPENGSSPPQPATTILTSTATKDSSLINDRSDEQPVQGRGSNPLFAGGRTRHARNRKRQAEELERKKQQKKEADAINKQRLLGGKENDDTSPEETAKSKKTNSKRKSKICDSDAGDDDDSASIASNPKNQSSVKGGKSAVPTRRKRRRKTAPSRTTKTTTSTARPPIIARRSETTGGGDGRGGITDSLSPFDCAGGGGGKNSLSPPTAASLSLQLKQKLQQHQRNHNKLCPPGDGRRGEAAAGGGVVVVSRRIGGAGRNVFAVQDAGNHQMIHDGCFELTTTILACPKGKILATRGITVETLAELAVFVSSTKTRRILWQQNAENDNKNNITLTNNSKALASILDVLHHITTALWERNSQEVDERWLPLLQKLQPIQPHSSSTTTTNNNKAVEQQQQRQENNIVENYYTGLMLDALIAIVSFLSWDVTIEHKDSVYHKNPKGARALRKAILEHEGILKSIVYLVRHADPMVSNILEAKAATLSSSSFSKPKTTTACFGEEEEESESTPHTSNSSKAKEHQNNNNGNNNGLKDLPKSELNYNMSNEESQEHNVFSQSSDLDLSSTSGDINKNKANPPPMDSQESVASASSQNTQDPTVAGRRKRRRKKGGGGTVLEPIAEDALSFNGSINGSVGRPEKSPPRSPPRVVFQQKNNCSQDSSLSPAKSSPARLRLGGNTSTAATSTTNKDGGGDDGSSMVSCDSALLKVHDHLGKARSRFIVGRHQQEGTVQKRYRHDCQNHRELHLSFGGKDKAGYASKIALFSLNRLLAGKDESDAHSCLDEVDEEPSEASGRQQPDMMMMSSDDEDEDTHRKPEDDDMLQRNPLLQTNMMIGNSGMIPFLAQGVAETLSALIEEMVSSRPCPGCIVHLHDKFVQAAPIVDNACLMHSANRSDLCAVTLSTNEEEENDDGGPPGRGSILVGTLTLFLKQWLREKALVNGNKTKQSPMTMLNEVALTSLRTLTSLTHDNVLSAEQFAVRYRDESTTSGTPRSITPPKSLPTQWNSVQVVGQVLHRAATCSIMESSKIAYDTRIFCLNTLANVVGEDSDGEIRRIMAALKLPTNHTSATGDSKKKESLFFLSWLTQWLISQTDSFQDAIMKGSFGKNNSNGDANQHHSNRELEKHEQEQLVTAGNGCVLLACLLQEPTSSDQSLASVIATIRETILSEMPLDDDTGLPSGTMFLKNTLRAFCNFLYHSMGDLSVAIVAPVKVLITKLEAFSISYSRRQ